jgi:GTPase SAR1 family protein
MYDSALIMGFLYLLAGPKNKSEKERLKEEMEEAMRNGTTEWGRCKLMLVGPGRAGKTALANTVIGRPFEHTESTIGINELTCDVKHIASGENGKWGERDKGGKEFEAGVAKAIAASRNADSSKKESKKDIVNIANDRFKPLNEEEEKGGEENGKARTLGDEEDKTMNTMNEATTEKNVSDTKTTEGEHKPITSGNPNADGDEGLDNMLVMKMLAESISTESNITISIFDYGGQSVFNVIHHLFLTRYGVYVLVFNMEWLASEASGARSRCLSYLKFWLNSVLMHTMNKRRETAPIVFAGTKKDLVSDSKDHQKISNLLYDAFQSSPAWPFVLEYMDADGPSGKTTFSFFPIDNTKGFDDPAIQCMMNTIESTIKSLDFVNAPVPLMWLQALDKFSQAKKAFLRLTEVEEIAKQCGIADHHIPIMLNFLHELGVLMWHEEPGLREVIIMDAVEYFVIPATQVICSHSQTKDETTVHMTNIHRKCKKTMFDDWQNMIARGVVSRRLLVGLLEESKEDINRIIAMMLKFGLIVQLRSEMDDQRLKFVFSYDEDDGSASPQTAIDPIEEAEKSQYLVPALLPENKDTIDFSPDAAMLTFLGDNTDWMDDETIPCHTCHFVFSVSANMQKSPFSIEDMKSNGFLPRVSHIWAIELLQWMSFVAYLSLHNFLGMEAYNTRLSMNMYYIFMYYLTSLFLKGLFERLVGRAAAWSQQTNPNGLSLDNTPLYQDYAILMFGAQRFRLSLNLDLNCIRVDVQGSNPHVVIDRLFEQIRRVTAECMNSLQVFTALQYPILPKFNAKEASLADEGVSLVPSVSTLTFIPLDLLQSLAKQQLALSRPGGRRLLTYAEIQEKYSAWLPEERSLKSEYDVFLSYRWGQYDSAFTGGLFDIFSNFTVGKDHRAPVIFLDHRRLENGRNYKTDFVKSLAHSSIIVPLLTFDALKRMFTHDANYEDNVLLEWVCALECAKRKDANPALPTRVMCIYPVMFGRRDLETGAVGNLFTSGILKELPDVVPTATLRRAELLLGEIGILPKAAANDDRFATKLSYSVREIVSEICSFTGFSAWKTKFTSLEDGAMLESAKEIMKILRQNFRDWQAQNQSSTTPIQAQNTIDLSAPLPSLQSPSGEAFAAASPTSVAASGTPLEPPPAAGKSAPKRTLNDIVQDIKNELGIEESAMNKVIAAAIENLGDEVREACGGIKTIKDKAKYIAEQLDIET